MSRTPGRGSHACGYTFTTFKEIETLRCQVILARIAPRSLSPSVRAFYRIMIPVAPVRT